MLDEALIILHGLVEVAVLVVANVNELLLRVEHAFLLGELLVVLDNVGRGFANVVQCDGQTNDLQLLLLDTRVVEDALLVHGVELLLKLGLDLNDFVSDALQINEPLFALLFLGVGEALLEVLELLLFFLRHIGFRLVHPVLRHQFVVNFAFVFLEDQFVSTHHFLQATLAYVVALQKCLFLPLLALDLFCFSSLLLGQVPFHADLGGLVDFEDVFGPFFEGLVKGFNIFRFLQTLKQVSNLLVLLSNAEDVVILPLFKHLKLLVEVAF